MLYKDNLTTEEMAVVQALFKEPVKVVSYQKYTSSAGRTVYHYESYTVWPCDNTGLKSWWEFILGRNKIFQRPIDVTFVTEENDCKVMGKMFTKAQGLMLNGRKLGNKKLAWIKISTYYSGEAQTCIPRYFLK